MNKHVPPSSIAAEDSPAPKPDEAKSRALQQPPQAKSSFPRQPGERPQDAPPQPSEADAGRKSAPDSPPAETNPFRRAFWTRSRLTLAAILAALVVGAVLSWPGGASKNVYVFVKASYGTITVSVRADGTLGARDSTDILAIVGGRVQSVLAKSGDRVVKGQIRARLESQPARDEVLRAQTEVASMQSRLAEAEADVGEARAAALRAKNDPKPGAYESAQARFARAQARLSELQAQSREAAARLATARAQIQNLDLRAPSDGTVLKSDIEPGQYVSAAGERGLFTLASDLSQLKLVADIPESQLGAARAGEQARFTVPAFPRRVFPAVLTSLDLWPKKETKDSKQVTAYPATLAVGNPDGALRPGMSATVDLIAASARNVLVVPNQALTFSPPPDLETKYPKPAPQAGTRAGRIWVLNGDNPEPRDVTLGLTDGRITQIAAGLRASEKVITSLIH